MRLQDKLKHYEKTTDAPIFWTAKDPKTVYKNAYRLFRIKPVNGLYKLKARRPELEPMINNASTAFQARYNSDSLKTIEELKQQLIKPELVSKWFS